MVRRYDPDERRITPVVLLKEDVDGTLVAVPDPTPIGGTGGGGGTDPVSIKDGTNPLLKLAVDINGRIGVNNLPATQPVSGSVSVSNFPATQPVSGTVTVSNPTTNPETGLAKDATLTARLPAALDADGGVKSHIQNFPASQAVTGTFWQATQPVSGPLTDAQLRATAVPVSGTFWQATQPISGTVTVGNSSLAVTGPLTDVQLRASAVPVSGPVTDAQLRASAVPVSLASVPTHAVTQSGSWSFAPAASTAATYTAETPLITPAAVNSAKEYLALLNPVGSGKVFQLRAMWVMLSLLTLTAQEVWARRITAITGGTAISATKNDTADANSAALAANLVHSPTSVTVATTTGLWQAHWVVCISGTTPSNLAHGGDMPGNVVRFGMDGQKPPIFRPGEGVGVSVVSRLGLNTGLIGIEWVEV